jgi:hypothetical protein
MKIGEVPLSQKPSEPSKLLKIFNVDFQSLVFSDEPKTMWAGCRRQACFQAGFLPSIINNPSPPSQQPTLSPRRKRK